MFCHYQRKETEKKQLTIAMVILNKILITKRRRARIFHPCLSNNAYKQVQNRKGISRC